MTELDQFKTMLEHSGTNFQEFVLTSLIRIVIEQGSYDSALFDFSVLTGNLIQVSFSD